MFWWAPPAVDGLQPKMRLTQEEIAFFKEYGYLIKRGAMDKELCAVSTSSCSAPPRCDLTVF